MGYMDSVTNGGVKGAIAGGLIAGPVGAALGYAGADKVGSQFAKIGRQISHPNDFSASAPVNQFQAQNPQLNNVDFVTALKGAAAQDPTQNPYLSGAGAGLVRQGNFADALMGRGTAAYGQEQGLIGQLQQEAAGGGPGALLAQQQLHEATDQNARQTAGMIASQRGINPALAARLGAQTMAGANQQAAGQAAQLGFQQQLAARQQLGSILGGEQNLYTGTGSNLLSNATNQGLQAGLGVGGLENQRLSTLGSLNQGQNTNAINASLGAQGINADVAKQNVQSQLGAQQINAGVANQNAQAVQGITGGILNAGGSMAAAAMAGGGEVDGDAKTAGDSEENDTVPAMLSPKEIVLPRSVTLAEDAPEKAAEFVAHLKGKSAAASGARGYGKILEKHRELKQRVAALEAIVKRSAS